MLQRNCASKLVRSVRHTNIYNVKVTHCICVVRDDENSEFKILTPCGICQERLRYWGEDV